MADYVRKYTCGTYEYYTYEGQYTKGHCSWYKTYYHHDDSCGHWGLGSIIRFGMLPDERMLRVQRPF